MAGVAYRADVDGMRAVAVIAVMIFHLEPRLLFAGNLGVDVFFVISGFLITQMVLGLLGSGGWSYRGFMWRRVRRLTPALAVVVAAAMLASVWIHDGDMAAQIATWGAASLAYVINFTMLFGGGDIKAGAANPYGHTWSLAVEMHFYLLWPLVLWALHRRPQALQWAIVAIGGVSFVAAVLVSFMHPFAVYLLTPYKVFGFMMGAFVAIAPGPAGLSAGQARRWSMVATVFVFAPMYTSIIGQVWFPISAAVGSAAAACLIWLGPRAGLMRALARPAPAYVGKLSYALYLVHWPILALTIAWMGADPTRLGMSLSFAQKGVALAASIVAALTLHHLVERPLRARGVAAS